MRHDPSPNRTIAADGRRSGAVLVVALICALLVSLLSAILVRTALAQVDRLLQDQQQMQADWLVQAGMALAVQRLRDDPEYAGETWLPPEPDGAGTLGRVVIEVRLASAEEATPMAAIHVTADVPDDPVQRVRVQQEWRLPAGDFSSTANSRSVEDQASGPSVTASTRTEHGRTKLAETPN